MAAEQRQVEGARTQSIFREVNERIRDAYDAFGTPDGSLPLFVCECGRRACRAMIRVPAAEYRNVRADRRRFIVASGHESPDAERVVERHDG